MAKRKMPFFKRWAPEWFVKLFLFMMTLPGISIFFLPLTNIEAARGYYGCEVGDIQFSVILFYAGYVGFYSLERRFFSFLATREYLLTFVSLQILACLICYCTKDVAVLFPVRFIQGMLFACNVNVSLTLFFTRLSSERGREISFSIFFGLLLCAVPVNSLMAVDFIDNYNFNIIYKVAIFSYLPCLIFLVLSMNNYRLHQRFPLYKLDWQSFVLFSAALVLTGYIMIFGQQYYWLEDMRILISIICIIILSVIMFIRFKAMKRPYIDLGVFKFRNFKIGLLFLFVLYICRFASGITNTYFVKTLHFDPFYVSYINAFNLAGIVGGVVTACYLVLRKTGIRYIWFLGFSMLFVFHAVMYFSFDSQANNFNYYIPLAIQGAGVGLLMVPGIIYIISSVPFSLGPSASATALAIRYMGFCTSIGIINYFELLGKSRHYNAFQDHISATNSVVKSFFSKQSSKLSAKGLLKDESLQASDKLLLKRIEEQSHLRFAMDYYEMMCWLLFATLLLILFLPYLNRTILHLKSRRLSPA
ncbi:beta-carotene 15,15'-monooxygenase [Elizabethkingia meningoseptica]|uniref:Beta-carotene 15,15'-monooxygenase n=2 Tax=Elizabethkingia meningoseptica TaxID=238 RepID=A0A1T3FLC9_ELIME|nr:MULTISPECIES: beta-carotene 15,15'-monooxygenase [Elizabethkingia]AQX14312.1 beta-carotene 15,15'-monooxygenase [Elizabethkingia meningoseptica]MCL1675162.1 beta-carotene 15,15'-monooxygenase [Elizabethkingia meningoseptica]MCL1685470.1 beta-carotene 15,15'-monooxygenase [Elizabethkingia meningoseptica]MDE5434523.1 beta-carotene 15,15'-monooxygenase [Elizabethkingia meningoseptica]MDE5481386.1 beta-carotene 15,15'-monooxygenase [Elizabethkingia meningoseptica]